MEADLEQIGIIIVDDDLPVRQLVSSYLADFPQVSVLGEASTGFEALELSNHADPDIIFLDIELPNIGGLSIAALIRERKPQTGVVFITGYPVYAAQAFQLDAVDYLVKPIGYKDLARTVKKWNDG